MLKDLIPIALFYFIYSFASKCVASRNRKNTLKMLVDNNLIKDGDNNINLNFLSTEETKTSNKRLLPIAMGMMGGALGLILSAYLVGVIANSNIDPSSMYSMKDAIQLGTPLFFAAVGVVVAYFIEKREKASAKSAE